MLTFTDLIEALTNVRPVMRTTYITEAAIDSRQINPGVLFVAIPGEKVDGHSFVLQAFQRGAVAALIEHEIQVGDPSGREPSFTLIDLGKGSVSREQIRSYEENPGLPVCFLVENTVTALQKIAAFWRRTLNLRVIGITGSVGKSTTKEAVAHVLQQRYTTLKSIGNLNNEIGLPLSVLKLTPSHQYAVLEMGFYLPGEIKQLCDIALPQAGVITNIGTVHAERAGSMAVIASGKAELVESLPPAPEGVAILNYDDPYIRPMKSLTKAKVFYYGITPEADLWADDVDSNGLEGIHFRLHYKNETLNMRVPMIGRHSVETVLRAASVGLVEGLTWDEIIHGLKESREQLRLSATRTENGALIIDDTYNASPESTMAALNLLEELQGRKIAVLGDMLELGQYEREGHEKVGIRVAHVVDVLVTYGVRAHMIAEAARNAGKKKIFIFEYEDYEEIVAWLKKNLTSDDAVLIKGSNGMQMEQIVAALDVEA